MTAHPTTSVSLFCCSEESNECMTHKWPILISGVNISSVFKQRHTERGETRKGELESAVLISSELPSFVLM